MAEFWNQCCFNFWHRQENIFFSTTSRPAPRPTQSPVPWLPGALSQGVKLNVTACLHLVSVSRMHGAVPPAPHVCMLCRGTVLPLYNGACFWNWNFYKLPYVLWYEMLIWNFGNKSGIFSLQATGIWLLTLLKHCPNREPIKQRLDALQKTFMDLLSENSGNSEFKIQ